MTLRRGLEILVMSDADVRVVVITGSERAFSAGGDMKEMGGGPDSSVEMLSESGRIIELIAGMPKLVIAAVRGHAAGAGMSLALACDLVLGDTSARFTPSFILRGLAPDMSGTYFLVRQVGLLTAKRIVMSGRAIDAAEAYALGLLAELWEPSEFPKALQRCVAELANGPTLAHGLAKQLLNQSLQHDLTSQLQHELSHQVTLTQSEDHREAVRAFGEGRDAKFVGR